MDKRELFIGKYCKVNLISDFVLEGIVEDIDEHGIIFRTQQKTSFISWSGIRDIMVLGD